MSTPKGRGMGEHEAPDAIVPGTVLAVGDPAPPTTTHKAWAAIWWALVPALLAAVLTILQSAGVLFPTAPGWVAPIVAVALIVLTPIAASFGVQRTPNLLRVPVQVLPAAGVNVPPAAP